MAGRPRQFGPPGRTGQVSSALAPRYVGGRRWLMIFTVAIDGPAAADDAAPVATSFPDFTALMRGLGADLG